MKTKHCFDFRGRLTHTSGFGDERCNERPGNALAPAMIAALLFLVLIGFVIVSALRGGW